MDVLDIKLGVFNKLPDVVANRETLIKKLVKNKATTYYGRAFKFIGTTMENVPDLLETTRVQFEEEAKEATKRLYVADMKGGLINQDTIASYNKSQQSGIPLKKSEHPYLGKQEFTALIKFILPIVNPNEAIYSSY